jgi:hypothetical protein
MDKLAADQNELVIDSEHPELEWEEAVSYQTLHEIRGVISPRPWVGPYIERVEPYIERPIWNLTRGQVHAEEEE